MAMTASTQITIGSEASCSDGACGEVSRVVVDPIAKAVTHLVVEPTHRRGLGRLVPLDLVDVVGGEVEIRCTQAEFDQLDSAEETDLGIGSVSEPVTSDTLPLGEVAVRRDERVHATDGEIGKVRGLVINPRNQHVTHVLLQEGHLWGRKEVAIPISAVVSIKDGIRLNIAKENVENLEPVALDHPNA